MNEMQRTLLVLGVVVSAYIIADGVIFDLMIGIFNVDKMLTTLIGVIAFIGIIYFLFMLSDYL